MRPSKMIYETFCRSEAEIAPSKTLSESPSGTRDPETAMRQELACRLISIAEAVIFNTMQYCTVVLMPCSPPADQVFLVHVACLRFSLSVSCMKADNNRRNFHTSCFLVTIVIQYNHVKHRRLPSTDGLKMVIRPSRDDCQRLKVQGMTSSFLP